MNIVDPIKNKEDIKKISEYLEKKNLMYWTIFIIGLNSGLRISDILNLNISDVKNKKYIGIYEQKTRKFKKFPINDEFKKALDIYLQFRENQKYRSKALFVGKFGHRLCRSQVYRFLNEACSELNIQINVGTHTLRKTFGYHYYLKTQNLTMLQKIFNHSTPAVTLSYIGITQENIDEAYMGLDYSDNSIIKTSPEAVINFLKNYLINGGKQHKEFAELALAQI